MISFQKKSTPYKEKCLDKFSSILDADFVLELADFYKNKLYFGGSKHGNLSLSDRRIRHMDTVIKEFDSNRIKVAMMVVSDNIKYGKTDSTTVHPNYFEKVLRNPSVDVLDKLNGDKQTDFINSIPIPKERIYNNYEFEFLNWVYNCPKCKEVVDGWTKKCPKCSIVFNWKDIKIK
jgi:hypothetical protein